MYFSVSINPSLEVEAMAMAQWLRRISPPMRMFSTQSKASRVISVPSPTAELTRVTGPTGILANRGYSIMDFLKTLGLEAHHDKLKTKCYDLRDVLVVETEVLKKLGLSVRDRKIILRYAHRYRLGTWTPRRFKVDVSKKSEKKDKK